jgi:hypothetical protein
MGADRVAPSGGDHVWLLLLADAGVVAVVVETVAEPFGMDDVHGGQPPLSPSPRRPSPKKPTTLPVNSG